MPLIGILALQGGFEVHGRMLEALGAHSREIRTPADLDGIQGLVIPGGESTTITMGVEREGLAGPIRELAQEGMPMLGSCAGLIMLDRDHLDLIDMLAQRNAFGRQIKSFEADLDVVGIEGPPLRGIFIRAPWVAEWGPDVEVLAELEGHPVAVRQGCLLAVAFHAELGADDRLHRLFLKISPASASPGAREPTSAEEPLRIALSTDELSGVAGRLVEELQKRGHDVSRHGAFTEGEPTDWAWASEAAAREVSSGRAEQAVVCCWTGTGASIAANKVRGARAALCTDAPTAAGARRYNDANVLALSLRLTSEAELGEILDAWFAAAPEGDEEQLENVARLREIEGAG